MTWSQKYSIYIYNVTVTFWNFVIRNFCNRYNKGSRAIFVTYCIIFVYTIRFTVSIIFCKLMNVSIIFHCFSNQLFIRSRTRIQNTETCSPTQPCHKQEDNNVNVYRRFSVLLSSRCHQNIEVLQRPELFKATTIQRKQQKILPSTWIYTSYLLNIHQQNRSNPFLLNWNLLEKCS